MSITDELRERAHGFHTFNEEMLLAIADRIDAEHERAVMSAMNDALYHANDESMAELGWVRLPKDADGEVIHIGDAMEVINSKQRAKACYIQMGPRGIWAVGLTKNCHWYDTESLRHYHAPTVEDVLQELVVDWDCAPDGEDKEAVLKEYAAKLRLAEGVDE